MPYSHHHREPSPSDTLGKGCKMIKVSLPGGENGWDSWVLVSEWRVYDENRRREILHNSADSWNVENKIPLVGKLSNLPDEVLRQMIEEFVSGQGMNWDFYQEELTWADKIADFSAQWMGVVEVNGHLWGWQGSGSSSEMGCIPLDRSESWEIKPEEGYRLSELEFYGYIYPSDEEKVAGLARKIAEVWYSGTEDNQV